MNSPPPLFNTTQFNDAAFQFTNYLTKYEADNYYIPTSYLPALAGTSQASKLMLTDASNSIQSINQIGFTTMKYGGTIITSTATQLNYLAGSVPGTAAASSAIVLDSSRNITNMNNITLTGVLTLNDTNDSIAVNNTKPSGRSNIRFQNDVSDYLESGIRGSSAANPRTHYWYSNGSYKLLMNLASGDISVQSSTQASSYSTGSIITAGGIGCAKDIKCNGNISLSAFGYLDQVSTLYLAADVSSSGILTYRTSDRSCYMQSGSVSAVYGYYNFGANGLFINRSNFNPIGSANGNTLLDFGSESHSFQINLYGGSYGITAADNALQLLSGGTNGIYFGRGASYTATSYDMWLSAGASLHIGNSARVTGFNTIGWTGSGLEFHYNGYGQIYSYNRSSLLYRGLYIGNEIYCTGGNQTSIGRGASATTWTLHVGSSTQSITSYAYLNSGGSVGTSGSSGSVAYSAYFDARIVCNGELDVLSDRRVKSDIRDITLNEAESFVYKCSPKWYIFRPESNREAQYGYEAQSVLKAGLDTLVVCRHEEGLPETVDEDGFVSPADTIMSISYPKISALLHRFILKQDEEIKRLREDLDLLLSRPVVRNWIDKQKNKE